MPILTLLTDFGTRDYYVGAVKGTVLRLAPRTTIVDLTHDIPPADIAQAAFVWSAAVPAFPAGAVHLAVVDPGVGSERRILVIEARGSTFLAPDNGLAGSLLEESATVRAVERADLFLASPGATFHGRDRFAPVAAFLLRGGAPVELGPVIDDPVRLPGSPPQRAIDLDGTGRLAGRVVHVDRYGNLLTDIPAAWLAGPLGEARIAHHGVHRQATHYAELAVGEVALLPGSLGTLELAANRDDLARRWGVAAGEAVEITFLAPGRHDETGRKSS